MAGQLMNANNGGVALSSGTAKTIMQVIAPTNIRVFIKGYFLGGEAAAGGTDNVVKWRATRSTANFGTGTAVTPSKKNTDNTETIQTTVYKNFTNEPTSPTDAGIRLVHSPQTGYPVILPPDLWIEIPGGEAVNFEATCTGTPTVDCWLIIEE